MSVHGSSTADTVIAIDGMRVNNLCGSGQFSGFYMNDAAIEEVTFTTGAESAEMQSGGLRINSTPKDGGNTFSGTFFAYGAGSGLQADNRTDAMKSGPAAIPQPASPIPGRSIRRSAGRSRETSCGSISPISTRTTRPTCQLAVRRWQPRLPAGAGQLQRRDAPDLGGVEPRQDPLLSRSAVQRRGLQRLQHAADDDSGSVNRRVRPWLGAAGQVDADHHQQAAARCRHLSYYTQDYEQSCRPEVGPRDLPRLEQTTNRLTRRLRQHHSAIHQLDQVVQRQRHGQLHHRFARDEGRHDHAVGHQLAHLLVERPDQHAGVQRRPARRAGQRHQPGAVHRPAVPHRRGRGEHDRPKGSRRSRATLASSSRTRGRSIA